MEHAPYCPDSHGKDFRAVRLLAILFQRNISIDLTGEVHMC